MTKKMMQQMLLAAAVLLLLPVGITYFLSREEISQKKEQTDIELYLPLILCRQVPWDYEEEMIKAQAVLTRSSLYLYEQGLARGQETSAGVRDDAQTDPEETADTQVQQYNDTYFRQLLKEYQRHSKRRAYRKAYEKMKQAAKDTEGIVLSVQGNVCEGVFHQISVGQTRDGEWLGEGAAAYLQSVDSSQDTEADHYQNEHLFTGEALRLRLKELYPDVVLTEGALAGQIKIIETEEQGYALTVKVGNIYVAGEQFRCDLELASSCFTMQEQEEKIVFLCQGVGHGFGLSQYGANELAKEGRTFEEILAVYFPDSNLLKKMETKV